MSGRNPVEVAALGQFGIGPMQVAQTFRNEVTGWKAAETNPKRLAVRLSALRDAAEALGYAFAALNPLFDHHAYMSACGLTDN